VTLTNLDNKATPPAGKIWCVQNYSITYISGVGDIGLYKGQNRIVDSSCDGTSCANTSGSFSPAAKVTDTQTLTYLWTCPTTCDASNQATITVNYDQYAAP
jgi:hypothetical protein